MALIIALIIAAVFAAVFGVNWWYYRHVTVTEDAENKDAMSVW
jgi:multidrug resistance efflux pump